MEKIKSRWRKNYLEGDTNNDDNNSDTGGYNNSGADISYLNNVHSSDHNHHHNNNSNTNDTNNSSTSNHHHNNHHHHHNHHHHSTNSNNSNTHHRSSSKHSTPPTYEPLNDNYYVEKRKNDRARKDARSIVCDCILTKEERIRGIVGCLDDCLNRMLMIECGNKCALGEHCKNKRFQRHESAQVEMFKTRKKGWGLRACVELQPNSFIMEYVGEVVRSKEFRSRVKKYTKLKVKHHYFMALRSDEIIDATTKGNLTRFINHSCEPNCETQKWTVNGDLRIGFFTLRTLQPGEEITFDYQFQRYGRKAQKCYCDAPSCRGYIGGNDSRQTFSLNGTSSPQNKSHKKNYKLLVDISTEDKINALCERASQGLKTKDQVIALASLSIKADDVSDRKKLLDVIKATKSEISLRLFVDYHGLEILCLWMRDPQADLNFKATLIDVLDKLPIPNKTKVIESNVYHMIEKWSIEDLKPQLVDNREQQNTKDNHVDTTTSTDKANNQDDGEKSNESQKSDGPNAITTENSDTRLSQSSTKESTLTSSSNSLPVQAVPSPNIKALASKLLKKFQALNPGFKIPRLNRLQRMEMEKKMDEEVSNDDKSNFEQNNPFARSYFKSTTSASSGTGGALQLSSASALSNNSYPTSTLAAITNGHNNSLISKSNIPPLKRRFDSVSTNNIDLTPAPKLSKEEHRQQFEMHVRLKDYYDTIEKQYRSAAVEQLILNQIALTSSINGLPLPYPQIPLAPTIPSPLVVAAQQAQHQQVTPVTPPSVAQAAPSPSQMPIVAASLSSVGVSQLASSTKLTATASTIAATSSSATSNCITSAALATNDVISTKPKPTNLPTLIVLANNSIEPAYAMDDKLAFSVCGYDAYYKKRDRPLGLHDIADHSYPYPGTYYTTPDGDTWFSAIIFDRKRQRPHSVVLNLRRVKRSSSKIPPPRKSHDKSGSGLGGGGGIGGTSGSSKSASGHVAHMRESTSSRLKREAETVPNSGLPSTTTTMAATNSIADPAPTTASPAATITTTDSTGSQMRKLDAQIKTL